MVPRRPRRWIRLFLALLVAGFVGLIPVTPARADTVVTLCANQTQLQTALNAGGRITFNCGAVTIPAFLLLAAADATIDGGNQITLDAQNLTGILTISANRTLTLTNITLAHGKTSGLGGSAVYVPGTSRLVTNNVLFQENNALTFGPSFKFGGAIFGEAGARIEISGGEFRGNVADYGGAIYASSHITANGTLFRSNGAYIDGGGNYLAQSGAIANTIFRGNTSNGGGGAIFASNSVTLTNSLLVTNTAGAGGGVWAGNVLINGTQFLSNTASSSTGGGVHTNANASVSSSTFSGNTATVDGGGFNSNGAATVSSSTFFSNTAVKDGGGFKAGGTATVSNSSFNKNAALSGSGGGFLGAFDAIVTGTTFVSNVVPIGDGGGVSSKNSSVSVTGSSFEGNRAGRGGGVWAKAVATVLSSTFTSNETAFHGGGVYAQSAVIAGSSFRGNAANNEGGGVWAYDGATISASSFISNQTTYGGGAGVYGYFAVTAAGSSIVSNTSTFGTGGGIWTFSADLTNVTLAHNRATSDGGAHLELHLNMTNTTVAGNSAPALSASSAGTAFRPRESILTGPALPLCQNLTTTFLGNNINRDPSSCGVGGTNVDPLLGPPQDNGGGTLTMAPAAGSLAIGASPACVLTFDQRGVLRTSPCDLGAYETGSAPSIISLSPSSKTALDPAFTLTVNGTGFISGTVALWNGSPRATTVLNSTTLSVSIPASDVAAGGTAQVQARYGLASDGTSNGLPFTINKRAQTITFGPLGGRNAGDPPVALGALASSGLAVSFAAVPAGACSVAGTTLTLLGAGTCTVTASQAGDGAYAAAAPVERAFTIAPGKTFVGAAVKGYAGSW